MPNQQNRKWLFALTKEFLSQEEIRCISDRDLARLLGFDYITIAKARRRFELPSTLSAKIQKGKQLRTVPVPDWQVGLFIGLLLGDGALRRQKNGQVSFSVGHTERQQEYIFLLYRIFENLCISPPVRWQIKKTGRWYYTLYTIRHPFFEALFTMFYGTGKKAVTQQALDLLTIPGLVMWFYDDGSRNGHSYRFATCSFTLEEHHLIRAHLFRNFGIKTTPLKVTNGTSWYWSLYVTKDTRHILEKYIRDFYLTCFDYKLHLSVPRPSETERKALWQFPEMKIQSDPRSDAGKETEMISSSM